MAFWYSALLFLFCAGFVLVLNLLIARYISIESSIPEPMFMLRRNVLIKDFTETQRYALQEARDADLRRIKDLSLYSLVPFVFLSFLGGYVIAERNLNRLEKLDVEMQRRNTKNLYSPIEYVNNGDEISSLIDSFNSMSKRLGRSFESQKEFVENASHELKTPLAIISANIDSILEDSKVSRKDLVAFLNNSKESVKFMNSLTEDLLLLSFLDQEISTTDIDIKEIVSKSIDEARNLDEGFNIFLSCEEEKIRIKGNKALIQRAFSNIIENALKYSKGDRMDVKVLKKDSNILIRFKDNGVGIPKDKRKKIFQRFYRLDKSRSRKVGGSGLGLAITSEIIKKHGGNIYANDVKKGAEFIVSLPL